MEAFRERFIVAELLSYKEMLFEEATGEWYAQRDPVEADWVESDCIRQAGQFTNLMEEYRERFFTYVLLQSHEVEHNYPCHDTSLLGLASYSSDYQKGCGLRQGWYPVLQLLLMVDFLCVNRVRYENPIQKVALNMPFQCATYSVLWMIIQK